MIASDPGVGKSTIATQAAVELAAGLPVFGFFNVPEPVKVFYIQTERGIIELLERFEVISKTLPIIYNNIVVTDEYQRLNLLNIVHADLFIEAIRRDYNGAKVIFIDPIYATVSGGLKEDKPASAFTKIMGIIQKEFDCTLWYNHHTIKPQYTSTGYKIEKEDPFYGSQWLKAHVTGSYYLKNTQQGVILNIKKDNYNLLASSISLEYDPETELCSVLEEKLPSLIKMENFLKLKKADKKEFTFKDIQAQTKLCTRTLRELLLHSSISSQIIVVSSSKNKNIYRVGGMVG